MPDDLLYGELADFRVDVDALRRHYRSVTRLTRPLSYRDGDVNYQGWSITSRDGSIADGVRVNNHNPTIVNAVVPTPLCTGPIRSALDDIEARGLSFFRARVFRLAGGYDMPFHTDLESEGWRLHLPIETCKGSLFEWQLDDGEIVSLHMPADGRAWLVRVDLMHRAINTGVEPDDRVHLLMSITTPPDRRHFGRARYQLPPQPAGDSPVEWPDATPSS